MFASRRRAHHIERTHHLITFEAFCGLATRLLAAATPCLQRYYVEESLLDAGAVVRYNDVLAVDTVKMPSNSSRQPKASNTQGNQFESWKCRSRRSLMYEMSCTGCGRRVSNQLIACPDCGTPVGYTGGTPVDRTQLRPTADPTQSASDKSTEGVQLREAGDYEAAVVICSEAIALAPNSAAYYRNRAQAHSRLGREDLALADAERAGAGRCCKPTRSSEYSDSDQVLSSG